MNSISSQIIRKLGNKQNKRLILNTSLTFLVKGGGLIISLFMLPAYMRYFKDQEVLGLWFTALSVLSWFLTFDLGIGNGLRNYLVKAFVDNDTKRAKTYISSAYLLIGAMVLLVSLVGFFSFPYIKWNSIFSVSESVVSQETLLYISRIIFIGIMLQFFLRLINSIFFALQKPAIPGFLALISNTLLLVFVLTSNSGIVEKNLKSLSYINIIATNLPLLLATIILFRTKLRQSIPDIRYYNRKYAINIIKLGGIFFWLQVMFMIIANTSEFLISWFCNTADVVDFKIYNSLFVMISTVFFLALTPVWSEITEANVKMDFIRIKKLYKSFLYIGLMAFIGEIGMILGLQILINFWLKDKAIIVDNRFSVVFALTGLIFIWNSILSSFANGLGKLKIGFIYLTFGAVSIVPLAYLFTHLTDTWIGVVMASGVSMLPFCIKQSIWLSRYFKEGSIKNVTGYLPNLN